MEQINLTNTLAGLAAIQRCMAGEDILFTRLEIGDGVLTNTDVSEMTSLINKTSEFPLGAIQTEDNEVIRLRSNISNKDINTDLVIREYGIYAKFGEEQEFLFAYLNVGESTTPLPSQRIGRYELNRDFVLYIGNSLHVDFTSNGHLVYVAVNEYKDDMNRKANVVGTIEDLKSSKKYKVGDVVEVLGYYSAGDGGGHPRQKAPEGYIGEDKIISYDGSIWRIVHSGVVSVSWFGAKSDNETNNTQFIQSAINLNNTNVVIIDNDYYIAETIIFSCQKTLEFKGKLIIDNNFNPTNDCVIFSSMWGKDSKLGAPHFVKPWIETKRYSRFDYTTEVAVIDDFVDVCGIIIHATAMASIHQPTILGLKRDGIIVAGGYGTRIDNMLVRTIPATLDVLENSSFTKLGDIGGEYFQNKRYPAGLSIYGTDCFIDNCQSVNYPVGIYTKNSNEFVNCHPWGIPQTAKTKMLYGFVITGTGNRFMGCYADTVSNINNLYEGLNGGVGFYETKTTDHTIKEIVSDRNIFINSKVLGTNFSTEGTLSFSLGDTTSNSAGLGNCLVATTGVNVRPEHVKLYNTKIQNILSYNSLGEFETVLRTLSASTINFSHEDSIRISGTGFLKLKSKNLQINDQSVSREIELEGAKKYPIFLPTTSINSISQIPKLGEGIVPFLYLGQELEAGSCGIKFIGDKDCAIVVTPTGQLKFIKNNKILNIQTTTTPIQQLDTPIYASLMKKEGIYEAFEDYMIAKLEYDSKIRELESLRQIAFEQRNNKKQTYYEWLSEQPMMLPVEEEPQPDEKLLEFVNRYV